MDYSYQILESYFKEINEEFTENKITSDVMSTVSSTCTKEAQNLLKVVSRLYVPLQTNKC